MESRESITLLTPRTGIGRLQEDCDEILHYAWFLSDRSLVFLTDFSLEPPL